MRNRNVIPSLDLLQGFEAAARHLSFTKAGEELFLTQSAVSRQIKELEDQLGVPLFHRRHRALALTDAGQQFYAAAAQVLTTMRTATSRLKAQSGRRPLSVTTTNSFAALWLIPRLAGFTRTHPGVDVRIMAETRVQDLDRDGLDLAIRHGPASLAGPNAVRLFGERVFPVCVCCPCAARSSSRKTRCASQRISRTTACLFTTTPMRAIPGCIGRPGWKLPAFPTCVPRERSRSPVSSRSSRRQSPATASRSGAARW